MGSVLLIVLAIFVGLLLLVAFWAIALYNGLIGKRNRFRNAFAQIEVQLQRRYDLIPNLVETAKGYMSHEKDTLEAVIAARNQAMGAMQAAAAAPGDSSAMANCVCTAKPNMATTSSGRSAMCCASSLLLMAAISNGP